MRIGVIGDTHLPFIDWSCAEQAADYFKWYKPDVIVQLGDLIDGYNWSLYPRAPDSLSAAAEWDATEDAIHKFRKLFGKTQMRLIEGNHCRRYMLRAMGVNIPKKLIRSLDDLFQFENWQWHMGENPLIVDGICFVHGDEVPGSHTAIAKATRLGMPLVQGHDHQGLITYVATFQRMIWAMSGGCMIDPNSLGARYAGKNIFKCFRGWSTITDKVPALFPRT